MRLPLIAATALSLALYGLAQAAPTQKPKRQTVAKPAPTSPSAQLRKIFDQSNEAKLKREPLEALNRGDLRYADQLGDQFGDGLSERKYRDALRDQAALTRVNRAALPPIDQLAFDVFRQQANIDARENAPGFRLLQDVRPIDHFNGLQTYYPDIASGQGAAPFTSVLDYENNIKRNRQYAAQLGVAIVRFREGMKLGILQPKLTVERMIEQLDHVLKGGFDSSPFAMPLANFPKAIGAADRERLSTETKASYTQAIAPAYQRLRDFLKETYLPKARTGVGLVHMKGGAKLYAFLIEKNTTLKMPAEQVHQLGLREVARILAEMSAIKQRVGFEGTLAQFFKHLRDDPRFQPTSKEWVRDEYFAIGARVDKKISSLFSVVPKTRLEIRPVPAFREKTDAAGSYNQGTPDGSRPGVFYYNTYDLPSRATKGMETLFLHEAVPGHHFQISLAQENAALPSFMRFDGNTAFVEGWALYAESLWNKLGMESDPYQRFGGLDDEMLRAMRLVVDTGLHAKGWTRERAIQYMLDNSSMGKTDAVAEVERYIANPAQALAYKIGQLTILRLRAKAEKVLGAKFDIRDFHAQVLMTGALPLTILEQKIDRWIAAKSKV